MKIGFLLKIFLIIDRIHFSIFPESLLSFDVF